MANRPFEAYLDQLHVITMILPLHYYNGQSERFFLELGAEMVELQVTDKAQIEGGVKYACYTPVIPEFGRSHIVLDERLMRTDLQIGAVIRTSEFDDMFYYDGSDLGASYTKESTRFRLWAPTATEVFVKYRFPDSEDVLYTKMFRRDHGVYDALIPGDLAGVHYQYHLRVNNQWKEAGDPYAKAVSVHSEWSCVLDEEKVAVPRYLLPPFSSPLDAIIYEASIRDFSMHPDSGIQHKGKYRAFTEKKTSGRFGQSTGVAYLKELGITHLELLPFNDFFGVSDTQPHANYNWGYNPLYFNVPEGSYSSDPKDPHARVIELKQMIESLHEEGIRVIMDVVYNHVYIRETSSFERIVPGYFFRQDEFGRPSNGTGVGNDFASERKMARKFILDSLQYWLTAYNVDGFRFDLMGILDVETMNEARKMIDRLKPGCILLGEGWPLNTALAKEVKANIANQEKLPGIAQFNDWFRDTIKGSTFHLYDHGFALGKESLHHEAFQVMGGSIGFGNRQGLFLQPDQSINYVESHDNYTLWDKLEACFPGEVELNKKRQLLATAMVLLSQGIPFLHSGQEFFRTKFGVENSYTSSDTINQLDWNRQYENRLAVEFIKGLIQIRKHHGAFRLKSAQAIRHHFMKAASDGGSLVLLLSNVEDYGKWSEILLVFHPSPYKSKVVLPSRSSPWKIIVENETAGLSVLREARDHLELHPVSLLVCVQSN
ncbi:type I pullulanase [Bacillus sp. REN10]|uniref:type I pullulanase n=1 Tax=Bacillus sp. REN10 TaxID=2782541 RepID=UPI00193C29CA|nr:type I pullulanase [Bacillus sp. REN10]